MIKLHIEKRIDTNTFISGLMRSARQACGTYRRQRRSWEDDLEVLQCDLTLRKSYLDVTINIIIIIIIIIIHLSFNSLKYQEISQQNIT
jgi:hypothetical protein